MARTNGYSWSPGVRREPPGGGEAQDNNPLPLSDAQLGIWFAQTIDPSSPAYNLAEYLEIDGPIDTTLFENRALSMLQTKRSRLSSAPPLPKPVAK